MRSLMTVLTEDEVIRIHEATLHVLENTGVRVDSDKAIKILVQHGAKADGTRVRMPKAMVEEAIRKVQKEVILAARDPKYSLTLLTKNFTYNATSGYSPFVKDMETGETRNSTAADLKDYAVLCDYLDLVAFFWPIAMPTEEKSPILEELCALDVSLRNTRKHIQCSCAWGTAAEYQIQLAAVVAGGEEALRKNPIFSAVASPNTPLIFEKDVVEAMIILAEAGVPVVPMNVPLAGTTAPVTLAGAITLTNAEQIATLVILKCANPDAPMVYSSDTGIADLRNGQVNYEAPEYPLLAAACAQMARYYGLPSCVAHGSSEVRPFESSYGFERNVLKIVMSQMTRTDLSAWIGSLDNAINSSLWDVVLDVEALEQALAYLRMFEVNDDTLALDAIAEAGPGGHFLAHRHTIKHFRKELWVRKLEDTFIFDAADDLPFPEKAKEKVREILSSHQVPMIDEDKQKEMDKIMEMARRKISK